ncbi:peptidylprolyl isomerase [Plantactinospora sp. GCM10030261]|uniref:peptidylprolyl isomerase n=1 Tax=Plantactinospora sp. GCM10030261 TaxID=3273420 RepID=UPI003622B518
MPSSRDRQRKLARAKLDRQLARRAAALRRRRRIQAGVGAAVALVLVGVGGFWALGGFDREPEPVATEICSWTPVNAEDNPNVKDVGRPATTDLPTSGTRPMTITTNLGRPITVDLDLTDAPCAGASFSYLAGKTFFDNTKCHEITTEGAVRCGDPSGTGQGGPTYSYAGENLPQAPEPAASPAPGQPPLYPAGTVALVGNPPGSYGSQFLIFFKDFNPSSASYPVIGQVTSGLEVVATIGAVPTVDNGSGSTVKPEKDVVIQTLTVGEVSTAAPSPGTPSGSPAGSPGAAPAASPAPSTTGRS